MWILYCLVIMAVATLTLANLALSNCSTDLPSNCFSEPCNGALNSIVDCSLNKLYSYSSDAYASCISLQNALQDISEYKETAIAWHTAFGFCSAEISNLDQRFQAALNNLSTQNLSNYSNLTSAILTQCNSAIADLNDMIGDVQNAMCDCDLSTVNALLASLTANVTDLETRFNQLRDGEVNDALNDYAALSNLLDELAEIAGGCDETVDALNENLGDAATCKADLESLLDEINGTLTRCTSDLAALSSTLQEIIARVNNVNGSIPGLEAGAQDCEDRVDALNTTAQDNIETLGDQQESCEEAQAMTDMCLAMFEDLYNRSLQLLEEVECQRKGGTLCSVDGICYYTYRIFRHAVQGRARDFCETVGMAAVEITDITVLNTCFPNFPRGPYWSGFYTDGIKYSGRCHKFHIGNATIGPIEPTACVRSEPLHYACRFL